MNPKCLTIMFYLEIRQLDLYLFYYTCRIRKQNNMVPVYIFLEKKSVSEYPYDLTREYTKTKIIYKATV